MADESGMPPEPMSESPSPGDESRSSGHRKAGLAALAIMAVQFLARIGGYIQKKVLAHFFATSKEGDAATGMQKVFEILTFFVEELLSHTVLPVFSRVRDEEGEVAAWRVASMVGTLLALLLVLLSVAGWFGADLLCQGMLKGFRDDPEKFALTVRLVRVSMLGLLVTCMSHLTYVLLNAYKRFVTPALGDVSQKIGIVLGTAIVCYGFSDLGPLGFAIGFAIGGLFKLLTHLFALGSSLRMVRPGLDLKDPAMLELGRLTLPLLAGTIVGKGRDVWEQRLASQIKVTGSLASLDYARKVMWMPISVIPFALGKALFPFLTDWARGEDKEGVTQAFLGASRVMVFVFLPLTVLGAVLGRSVITFLYVGGKFNDRSVDLTYPPFLVYCLGFVFYALEIIALQVYYAHRDTKTPFYNGIIGSTIHILVAWLAGLVLGLNNAGIALGFAVAKAVKTVLLWWQLRDRLTSFELPRLGSLILKTGLASAVMAVWLVFAKEVAPRFLDITRASRAALFIAGAGGVGLLIFFVVAVALRVPEVNMLIKMVSNRLKRRKS